MICPMVMVFAVTPGPVREPVTLGGGGMLDVPDDVPPELVVVALLELLVDELHAVNASPAAPTVAIRRTVNRLLDDTLRFPFVA